MAGKHKLFRFLMSFVLILSTLITGVIPSGAEDTGFNDVQDPKAYYYNPVYWAVEEGVTAGTSADTFSPAGFCTRAQIVTFIWRLSGEADAESSSGFSDVPESAYYAQAVSWAVEQGITSGTSATTFSPQDPCTRAQIVTFLWRLDGKPSASAELQFSDVSVKNYFAEAVSWAVDKNVTTGTSKTTFSPQDTCTRAQAVTFIHRYYQSVTEKFAEEIVEEDTGVTFSCDPDYVKAGVPTKVCFYAGDVSGDDVQVVPADGSGTVAMNDAGVEGDVEAADGIYTGSCQVTVNEGDAAVYELRVDGKETAGLTIETYTDDDFDRSREAIQTISEKSGGLAERFQDMVGDPERVVDESSREEALKEIGGELDAFLEELESDGEILGWEETDETYFITLSAGTCVVPLRMITEQEDFWSVADASLDSGTTIEGSSGQSELVMVQSGSDTERQSERTDAVLCADTSGDTRSLIASIEPFYLESVTEWHDKSAELIEDSVAGFRFATTVDHDFNSDYYTIDGQPVLAAQAMNFYRDQLDDYNVIIWNGHGVYANDAGSFLYSGVYHSYLVDELYADDLAAGRLYWSVIGGGKYDVMYALTGGFIQYHYKTKGYRLNDALVYVGACHGGQYGGVCRSFIASGAKAAIGFDEAINKDYEADFVRDFFHALVKKNMFTGASAEVTTAFNSAVFKNKAFEELLHASGQPAKPVLYKASGPDYRLTDYAFRKPDKTGLKEETGDNPGPQSGTVDLGEANVGDYVTFGHYEQDNDTENGMEAIEWKVLDKMDGCVLLISKYGLDAKPYNETKTNVTWETCTLRSWLNSDFLYTAFSSSERSAIPAVTLPNPDNPNYGTTGGNDTDDRVFLLSLQETQEYFALSNTWTDCDGKDHDATGDIYRIGGSGDVITSPTAYAAAQGVRTDSNYHDTEGNVSCEWWLRSSGRDSSCAADVSGGGSVRALGNSVSYVSNAVRPALWVNLES